MRKKLLITLSSFRKIHNFTPKSNHLSFEGGSSKLQWRGWSHAAAAACVPSETEDIRPRKNWSRVPKHERRAMVESFVNKYKSENAGKFPAIKYTQKEVGGSYYTVRDIIQELKYKSKVKSLNSTDEILVEKVLDESKLKTAESVNVSSENIETAKDRPIQKDSQSVLLDDKEAVNTCCELEEKRGPQTFSQEGRLSYEVETISTTVSIDKRREQPALEDMYGKASHSNSEVTNDVKSDETVSSCPSDYVAPEIHLLKEEIEQVSAPIVEKSGSSCSKDHIHDSKSVDIKNHPTIKIKSFDKAGLERKVQDGAQDLPVVDSPQHIKEQSQESLKLDESKIDGSNMRESSVAVASDKSTLWGNLKSFADGVLNMWRKL